MVQPEIIFEDKFLIVLDKPAGWVVNRAETTKRQKTVQDWLKKDFDYPLAKNDAWRSGIVHRLDKETSGLLVIAKTKKAFLNLQEQFKKRLIFKEYLALVHGEVEEKRGVIDLPVGRLPWSRKRFGVIPGGRKALTHYHLLSNFQSSASYEKFSLLRLWPRTGRTHQIRIHLKYLKHPIVADNLYAGRKLARKDSAFCPRLFLHASKIRFIHPNLGKKIDFISPIPHELKKVLSKLEKLA